MKKIVFAFALALVFTACSQKKADINPDEILNIELADSSRNISDESTQLWHTENKKVFVFYGYDFNDDAFVSSSLALLSKNFGLADEGGLVVPIVFPNDFKHGKRNYSTELKNILTDSSVEPRGLVILGAPENTHRALASIQDEWNGTLPYPVISLFPQDDALGVEDTSDIVIDKLQKAEIDTALMEESENIKVQNAEELIYQAVHFITLLSGPIEKSGNTSKFAKLMIPNRTVRRYADSETGIFSVNHFVIE